MSFSFHPVAFLLVVAGIYILVKSVLTTLGSRMKMDRDRHNMLINVKKRRHAYVQSLTQQHELNAASSSVIIEDC